MPFIKDQMQNENRIFTPIEFLEKFYSQTENSESKLQENTQQKWGFQAFDIIPESQSCLEIGSGPVLNLAACASRKCKKIYLTDFNTDCFELTKKELSRNPDDENAFWISRFTVIAKLQNISVLELMKRVQDRVVACFKCDMHKDELLEIPYFKKVDVITSSLAMESAAIDFDHYQKILGNFKKYLKPKGYVYFYGTLEESYYIVEGKKLPVLYLNEQKIRSALTKKNFEVIKFNKLLVAQSEQLTKNVSDAVGYYSVLAKLLD